MLYLNRQTQIQTKEYPRMASITQDMRFRLSLIKYAERYGVSNAARREYPKVCVNLQTDVR